MHMVLVLRKYSFKLEQLQERKGNLKPKRFKNCGLSGAQEKSHKTQNETIQQAQTNNTKNNVDYLR